MFVLHDGTTGGRPSPCCILEMYMTLLQLFDQSFAEEDLGLQYFLTDGGLLGAIRHGYFIPWDAEEVDVVVKE